MVAQDRSFLKPRRSGKSGTSHTVAFEHAKASAALAASFKSRLHQQSPTDGPPPKLPGSVGIAAGNGVHRAVSSPV
jgi:hypothetical protein